MWTRDYHTYTGFPPPSLIYRNTGNCIERA